MLCASFSSKTGAAFPAPKINGTAEQQKAITELFQQFDVTTEKAQIIVEKLIEEMQKGLDHEGATGKKNK
jgi:hexokinase